VPQEQDLDLIEEGKGGNFLSKWGAPAVGREKLGRKRDSLTRPQKHVRGEERNMHWTPGSAQYMAGSKISLRIGKEPDVRLARALRRKKSPIIAGKGDILESNVR